MVMFLYRPEYYGITQDEEGNDCRGIGEIIIAKHRNGALGTVRARFINQFAKFANLESDINVPLPGQGGGGSDSNVQLRSSRMNEMNDNADDLEDSPF